MASTSLLVILKLLMILLCAGWISIWLLKPTDLWATKWKGAEDNASNSVFGYNGLDLAVYTFPVIAVAIIGFIYLELKPKDQRSRQARSPVKGLSNPLIVNSYLGIFSTIEILAVLLFILFLTWTFYAHVSNDFKKIMPVKNWKLNMWQFKIYKMSIRFGLLAEASLALLLLPVLRGLAVFRLLGLQFEVSVRYHVWLGTAMILFATLHGSGTFFIWGLKHHIQDEMWKWQKTGRIYLAGEIALVTGLVIWITSLPQIRRKQFEIFYYTHHLYIVFLVFFLFHVGDRHFYMVFPGIFLFALDKLLRIIQSRPQTCILSARVFPCKAMELVLPKDPRLKYTPASVIFMKVPSISNLQWHSFTISSSSSVDEHTMSVIMKCEGWWTSSLYNIVQQTELGSDTNQMKCIPVSIEGPYGPDSLDFLSYDSLLLVAGGIGITPFLSILQEFKLAQSSGRKRIPAQIQLIYVVKKSQDVCLLDSVLPLLLNQAAEQFHLKLKVFVTQEKSGSTLPELLNEFCPVETINFDTQFSNYAIHGLENLFWMAVIVGFSSIMFLIVLCCFNRAFIHPAKKAYPSSIIDLYLICSFAIAIICGTLVSIMLRWRKIKKELPPRSQKHSREIKPNSMETSRGLEEHEIHFGGRPNFQDVFSQFPNETGGSDIGVLVCGPETMKESVALMCQMNSEGGIRVLGTQRKKPYFSFQSLNFAL
ncbi:hypothetical protein LOK49_LG14G01046 [Camellia lanceoleosa]|uniref:Uncharacterized protein n=1 Tax=Camellia lanceoleosa TaxID=1840588 RepID=A0ACC0F8R9_9ERIC|nr:hypothetical protein LOK49_LG14G01046 [Camellia lanceoleosa]